MAGAAVGTFGTFETLETDAVYGLVSSSFAGSGVACVVETFGTCGTCAVCKLVSRSFAGSGVWTACIRGGRSGRYGWSVRWRLFSISALAVARNSSRCSHPCCWRRNFLIFWGPRGESFRGRENEEERVVVPTEGYGPQ